MATDVKTTACATVAGVAAYIASLQSYRDKMGWNGATASEKRVSDLFHSLTDQNQYVYRRGSDKAKYPLAIWNGVEADDWSSDCESDDDNDPPSSGDEGRSDDDADHSGGGSPKVRRDDGDVTAKACSLARHYATSTGAPAPPKPTNTAQPKNWAEVWANVDLSDKGGGTSFHIFSTPSYEIVSITHFDHRCRIPLIHYQHS